MQLSPVSSAGPSPSAELRDRIDTFRQLAMLYRAVRTAYADSSLSAPELARKTRRLVEESASMYGLGTLTKAVTFDRPTIESLRNESGSNEAKVFNLVRGLRAEADGAPELDAALRPIRERAENVLRNLERGALSGLAAMDMLVGLAAEKDTLVAAARDSELPLRPFSVCWMLRDSPALEAAGVSAMEFAREVHTLANQFPGVATIEEERRRLRTSLYIESDTTELTLFLCRLQDIYLIVWTPAS